jgi:hypothetical protein
VPDLPIPTNLGPIALIAVGTFAALQPLVEAFFKTENLKAAELSYH